MWKGLEDIATDQINYPNRAGSKLLETHPIASTRPTILSVVKNATRAKKVEPNFFVLSPTVYIAIFSFVILCSFVSALASRFLRRSKRHERTLMGCTRRFFNNLLWFTLALIGSFHATPHRAIQWAIIMGSTFILAQYNATFSTGNLHISLPKIYNTYESVAQDPPVCIQAGLRYINYFTSNKFSNSSVEKYIYKFIRKFRLDCTHAIRESQKVIAMAYDAPEECAFLKVKLKLPLVRTRHATLASKDTLDAPNVLVAAASDPDAPEVTYQFPVSNQITKKLLGGKLLQNIRLITELGLEKGAKNYENAAAQKVKKGNRVGDILRHRDSCISSLAANLNSYSDITLSGIKTVFLAWAWLFILPTCILMSELLALGGSSRIKRKQSRVHPMERRPAATVTVKTVHVQMERNLSLD